MIKTLPIIKARRANYYLMKDLLNNFNVYDQETKEALVFEVLLDYIESNDYLCAEEFLQNDEVARLECKELLKFQAYLSMLNNNLYRAELLFRKLLSMYPTDVYCLKNIGIVLYRLDNKADGINYLKQAVCNTDHTYLDPFYDLLTIYNQENKKEEFLFLEEKLRNCIHNGKNGCEDNVHPQIFG